MFRRPSLRRPDSEIRCPPHDVSAIIYRCPVWNKVGTFGVFAFGFANWSWLIGL